MGLSYLQELTIKSEVNHYMSVAISNSNYHGVLEAYFLLVKFSKQIDLVLEVIKHYLSDNDVNKAMMYYSSHLLPIDTWAHCVVQEIKDKRDTGLKLPDGESIPISEEELKCKIINYLRVVSYSSPILIREMLVILKRELPEYSDIFMMFNDVDVPSDSKVSPSQFYEVSSFSFSNILPLSYTETEALYKPRYIVEAVDKSNNNVLSRKEFNSLKEAKMFKNTMDMAVSIKEGIDIVLTQVIGKKLSESINVDK